MQVDIELYRRQVALAGPAARTLSVIDIAPENPRRTLVFVHGYGGNARQWIHQLTHFSDQDRVVAADLIGHGHSARPPDGYQITDLVGDLHALAESLRLQAPFVLVGHSFGGAIGVEYALAHPDNVERLVLIAAAGEYPLARRLSLLLSLPTAVLNLIYPFVRRSVGAPPYVLKRMRRSTLDQWNGWDRFGQLGLPTLVIRGHRDRVFARQYFEKVAHAIPKSEDLDVGASGHMVMLERREAVNRAIERFVDGPRSWRDTPARSVLLKDRPWLPHYDAGIPLTIGVPDIPLDELLYSAARRFPFRPAIHFEGLKMTYRRLDREVNRFARGLLHLRLQPGDRVMILLPNLPQTVVSFYGTLRAGATVTFASPISEPEELLRQIEDSGATVLVTLSSQHQLALRALTETTLQHVIFSSVWDYLPWGKGIWFQLTRARREGHLLPRSLPANCLTFGKFIYHQKPSPPEVDVDPASVALLQFTSGTTDVPKGVMLSHRNLVANTLQTRHWIPDVREGREVVLSVLPFSHIYGLMAALSVPIVMAGAMVLLPTFVTRQVLAAIRRHRPTLFPGVPTMYTVINDFPGVRKYGVESIRACISGAAPLPIEVQEAFEKLTRGRLVEGYGLTEAGPVTHANPFNGLRKVGSIGLPFPSTEARIIDLGSGKPARPGQIGELLVRGPQVMMGYWNDPEGTREVLQDDGWLRTVDLASSDDDGYFQIVARKKEMILAGEYQVYPRDVEEVLYEHPKVHEAAVIGVQRPRWPFQRVKAYVVLKKGQLASEEELIELCRRRLEQAAVPWRIEFVDQLPKSFVGKVLRRMLIEADERPSA